MIKHSYMCQLALGPQCSPANKNTHHNEVTYIYMNLTQINLSIYLSHRCFYTVLHSIPLTEATIVPGGNAG